MYYDKQTVWTLLQRLRSRRRLLLTMRGIAISLSVIAIVILLTGWSAHRYRHNETALLVLRVGALLICLATVFFSLVYPQWRKISDARLARLVEEKTPGLDDRLVTAVEFSNPDKRKLISPAIVNRMFVDANETSATLDLGNVIRRSRLQVYGAAALASVLIFAGVLKWGPREISQGVAQLVTPTTHAASANALSIKLKPGTARVPKGSDQDIIATLVNFDSASVTIFARPLGSKDDWQGQGMEPAKAKSDFRFSVFNIQDSMEYFVESNNVRSDVHKLTVVDLPYVKQLDLKLNFPAFSNVSAKTIEDGGDIAALKGTVASITAKLTGKVKAARIVFPDGRKTEMRAAGSDFVGEVTVSGDTSYYIELISLDGENYRGSNEYDITVLEDQPPVISFDRPGRDKKATNLEEVFTQARAEDDYGVVSIELHFAVNGGDEKKVSLQQLSRESARSLTGAYTFFLEEYSLKPGDFISYYAKARDASNEATSDIYFIEIKPFEMEFRQAQQQGGQGGGQGGDQEQNALSRRQKDIIAATHRLIREGDKYTPQERKDGYEAVATGQEKLRTDTLEFLDRMGRRLGGQVEGQQRLAEVAENLRQAAKEMEGAPPPLRKEAGREALPPEQRALQRLLAADAIFREVQVAFGNQNNGGGGGGGERQQQELAGLFELELDKMKNQYETVQRAQRQQAEQAKSEAERKLEELARRHEQALEEQRRRMGQAANSSGGGSQRQQQELIEETRRAARELERLSRERGNAELEQLSRQLNQTADEMQRAQASARNNADESVAQNERALDRLRQAQQRLQQSSGNPGGQSGQSGQSGRSQQVSDLRQRAAQAAARQREIARDMENLSRRGGQNAQDANSQRAREQLAERKDTLADTVDNLRQDIEESARGMGSGQGQQRAARQLKNAAEGLARDRVAERIREGKQALGSGQQQGNRSDERAIERSLNNLSDQLQSAEQSARNSGGSGTEEALDRTRQLADDLDSLRRRLDENAARRNGNGQQQGNDRQGQQGQLGQQGQSSNGRQQGSQQGQQQGQQQGGQQQGGTQNGGQQQGGQQQGGTQNGGQQNGGSRDGRQYGGPTWGPMGGDWGDNRQLPSEVRERLRDAENLRREWGGTTTGPARRLDEVIERLKRMADGRMEGDAQTAALLKSEVIEPLRQLELELSRQLQQQSGRTNLRLRDEGAAPERYRRAVEEYYRRLSGARPRQ